VESSSYSGEEIEIVARSPHMQKDGVKKNVFTISRLTEGAVKER
jgi:hypothetical protein